MPATLCVKYTFPGNTPLDPMSLDNTAAVAEMFALAYDPDYRGTLPEKLNRPAAKHLFDYMEPLQLFNNGGLLEEEPALAKKIEARHISLMTQHMLALMEENLLGDYENVVERINGVLSNMKSWRLDQSFKILMDGVSDGFYGAAYRASQQNDKAKVERFYILIEGFSDPDLYSYAKDAIFDGTSDALFKPSRTALIAEKTLPGFRVPGQPTDVDYLAVTRGLVGRPGF